MRLMMVNYNDYIFNLRNTMLKVIQHNTSYEVVTYVSWLTMIQNRSETVHSFVNLSIMQYGK